MPRKRTDTTAKAHPNDYKKSVMDRRKGARYDEATKAKAFQWFIRFNGRNRAGIVRELRKEYPWLTEATIEQWEKERHWRAALEIKIAHDKRSALTSADELSDEVETIRKQLFAQIRDGSYTDDELIKLHEKYVARSVEILTKVKEARDTLGGFVAMLEKLCEYLIDISPDALESLAQVKDEVLTRAAEDYGSGDTATTADDTRED